MSRFSFSVAAGLAALLLMACGSTSNPTATDTSSPSPSPSPSPSVSAGALSACDVVTSQEASSLAGTTFGAGTLAADTNGGTCVYGAQTTNVFTVSVGFFSDAKTAQAQWDAEKAKFENQLKNGIPSLNGVTFSFNVSEVSVSGADKAAVGTVSATISGQQINGSAMYLLKGSAFAGFSDLTLNHPAPTAAAMEAEAATVLGRLP
jgi:hypothetical protein